MASTHHQRDSQVMLSLYLYDPSIAAACVFVALFSFTFVAHAVLLFRKRTRYFIPFLIGIVCEILGYVARAVSAAETPNWHVVPYALQSLMLLIAPPVRPEILTKVFITSDVLSFLVQSGGGGILTNAKTSSNIQLGENVIIVGLLIQLIGFALFISVTAIFHRRVAQDTRGRRLRHAVSWAKVLWILYGVSVLILIRSLFRVIEYIQGYDGYLQTTEVFLYIFDAALMFLVTFILAAFHPSAVMTVDEYGNIVSPDGSQELGSFVSLGTHSVQKLRVASYPKYGAERELTN
ncbi:Protein RTM1 [Diaporthe amygdali]|uniref:Protein RTM1 n=1 Tax=Phomopsis amygdali TaxID=1214568 RepID=UPI0022FE24FC|nr:Protein RTM1 [Diaporthe amygdali]KAJ0125392.1 Protein RTM1 [Diaporthe amygdali]